MNFDQNNVYAREVDKSQISDTVQALVNEKERMAKIHTVDVNEFHSSNVSLGSDLCEAQNSERVIQKSESIETTSTSDEETGKVSDDGSSHKGCSFFSKLWNLWCLIYDEYSFLVLICLSVLVAFAYPPLGAIYVRPQISASWCAVIFIFGKSTFFVLWTHSS